MCHSLYFPKLHSLLKINMFSYDNLFNLVAFFSNVTKDGGLLICLFLAPCHLC